MKKLQKQTIIATMSSLVLSSVISVPIFAVDTAILDDDGGIEGLLNTALVILTTGVGIAAVIAYVVAGVMYITAASNADQVRKAKTMIFNTTLGLLAYALMWAFLQWLIPGGVL